MILFIITFLNTLPDFSHPQYGILPIIVAALISAGVSAGVGGVDIATKRKLEKNLAKLSSQQAKDLQEQLNKEQDKQVKLALLQKAADNAEKANTRNIIIGSVLGLVGLISAIILLRKKK
jgi:hypothetical protein